MTGDGREEVGRSDAKRVERMEFEDDKIDSQAKDVQTKGGPRELNSQHAPHLPYILRGTRLVFLRDVRVRHGVVEKTEKAVFEC